MIMKCGICGQELFDNVPEHPLMHASLAHISLYDLNPKKTYEMVLKQT